MLRRVDQAASLLVVAVGGLHLLVGRAAFTAPTERGVWFASAGFLLITTGLANLACAASPTSRLQSGAAASGALAILVLGGLLAAADPAMLAAPQTLTLFALGAFLLVLRLRELTRRRA